MKTEVFFLQLCNSYADNVRAFDELLRPDESFDLIKRRLFIGSDEATFYYIDGFVKDEIMQKLMQYFLGLKGLPRGKDAAKQFADRSVP